MGTVRSRGRILDLERRYFVTAGGRLPYYKVERIELYGETLFERKRDMSSGPLF